MLPLPLPLLCIVLVHNSSHCKPLRLRLYYICIRLFHYNLYKYVSYKKWSVVTCTNTHTYALRIPHRILIRFDWSLWTFHENKILKHKEKRVEMHQICQMHGGLLRCCCCFLKPWLISVQDMWCVLLPLLPLPLLLNVIIFFCMGRSPSALFNEFWWHFVFSRDFIFRCFTLCV